jgi:hypothetical protein
MLRSNSRSRTKWLELARKAERIGVDSVWVPEFWAYDAFTPLAAIAARTERVRLATGIAQLSARTPTMLAMSAMSLQRISGDQELRMRGRSRRRAVRARADIRNVIKCRSICGRNHMSG